MIDFIGKYWFLGLLYGVFASQFSFINSKNISQMSEESVYAPFPNLYIKLYWQKTDPSLPKREGKIEIWLKGDQFRVKDSTGRYAYEILADIQDRQGLGHTPATLEEIMDIDDRYSQANTPKAREFWGNRTTGKGWIREPAKKIRPMSAYQILPIAEQVFSQGIEKQLQVTKTSIQFGQECQTYEGILQHPDKKYFTKITQVITPPYVLLHQVQNKQNPSYYLQKKVVEFQPGQVTDDMLKVPTSNQD